jgi:hypothetical protein
LIPDHFWMDSSDEFGVVVVAVVVAGSAKLFPV